MKNYDKLQLEKTKLSYPCKGNLASEYIRLQFFREKELII